MLRIMLGLTKLLGSLVPVLICTVLLGACGYLSAIGLMHLGIGMVLTDVFSIRLLLILFVCALLRGVLHYLEQLAGHYMAFRLLADLRDRVFAAMRRLAPAKLAKQEQGEWIAVLTGDIELLEVYYAHTLPPILIALLVSSIMTVYLGMFHVLFAVLAAGAYLTIGLWLPWRNAHRASGYAKEYRDKMGEVNGLFLESLYGMGEVLRFRQGAARKAKISQATESMAEAQSALKRMEGSRAGWTEALVLLFSLAMTVLAVHLVQTGAVLPREGILASVGLFSSFGAVVALANLSGSLSHTLAAGERVLALLQEEPETPETETGLAPLFCGGECQDVSFWYKETPVLSNVSFAVPPKGILGISGKSGSGKSTLLKLFMRYWDPPKGRIMLSGVELERIHTRHLRHMEGSVTQETFLFEGTLLENIRLSDPHATLANVRIAAKKAGIDDFLCSLPKGYDTRLGELGNGLSAGERQRIGLARAFLHGADFLLLDEPTSNLDALNEAILLRSLQEAAQKKSILLVSHRPSALRVADAVYTMDGGRKS